jgi:hypothetical protein
MLPTLKCTVTVLDAEIELDGAEKALLDWGTERC